MIKESRTVVVRSVVWLTLVVVTVFYLAPTFSQDDSDDHTQQTSEGDAHSTNPMKSKIAGLNVAIWKPVKVSGPAPLVIFSHGYHGHNTQSKFIMEALAKAGYLVIAPNHKDALGNGSLLTKPDLPFRDATVWTEDSFKDRREDITKLIAALHKDPSWNSLIDWSKLALAGHSLGGYTVLALAGAWPGWKISGVKAVLALSPYCQPFVIKGTLHSLNVPIMYQGGTRDFGITPTINTPRGAYNETSSPACFVDFAQFGHFAWTDLNRNQKSRDLINYYAVSFLDKYVRGTANADPGARLRGVVDIEVK